MGAYATRAYPGSAYAAGGAGRRPPASLDRRTKRAPLAPASWQVRICSFKVRGSTFVFDLEVNLPDAGFAFGVSRTLEEFQRAHDEVKAALGHPALSNLPNLGALSASPSRSPARSPEAAGSLSSLLALTSLQRWLNVVQGAGLPQRSPALQNLFGIPSRANLWAAPGSPSLTMLAECHQPLLLEIASYVSGSATDLVQFAHLTSRLFSRQLSFARETLWESAFAARWPSPFHECLCFRSAGRWEESYRATLGGKREYIMEVFDREKKKGFAMAAMAARITYDKAKDSFVARYISASEVKPEAIPARESRRLRFCPPSARGRLNPSIPGDDERGRDPRESYPYRVLEGYHDLVVGGGVELQWKMQKGSPFGWWFGHLEQLLPDADGKQATATITFRHFPSSSRWHRLAVRFGDNELRECSFGGYTGGIRAASPGESEHWMSFFPRDPVVF